jgi:hypothetical protein
MNLSDALTQFETAITKTEGGLTTMSPDDLVKYIGSEIALATAEGDAGKERLAAVKAVIEAAKAAEATGATTFEVKPFVTAEKAAETPATKDPILTALESLSTQVASLKATVAAPAVTQVEVKQGDAAEVPAETDVSKAQGDAGGDAPTPKPTAVRWPTDLNSKG